MRDFGHREFDETAYSWNDFFADVTLFVEAYRKALVRHATKIADEEKRLAATRKSSTPNCKSLNSTKLHRALSAEVVTGNVDQEEREFLAIVRHRRKELSH